MIAAVALQLALTCAAFSCNAHAQDCSKPGEEPDGGTSDEDEDIAWLREHGWQSMSFGIDCVSKAEDGSAITTEPLPIGNGRWVECTTDAHSGPTTFESLSQTNERWCALGELTSSVPRAADPSLRVEVKADDDSDSALLSLTVTAEVPTGLSKADFFIGKVWPVWIEAVYDTTELERLTSGLTCDQQFDLEPPKP